jgi:acyl carrier protein
MNRDAVLSCVVTTTMEAMGLPQKPDPNDNLAEVYAIDSLDLIGLIMRIEIELGLPQIPDEVMDKMGESIPLTPVGITDLIIEHAALTSAA